MINSDEFFLKTKLSFFIIFVDDVSKNQVTNTWSDESNQQQSKEEEEKKIGTVMDKKIESKWFSVFKKKKIACRIDLHLRIVPKI